uniref:Uncharacterized protein n=1 Tax=Arundo donax TaxID=35708 RepID=A0A0A9A4L6_ARUDO
MGLGVGLLLPPA